MFEAVYLLWNSLTTFVLLCAVGLTLLAIWAVFRWRDDHHQIGCPEQHTDSTTWEQHDQRSEPDG